MSFRFNFHVLKPLKVAMQDKCYVYLASEYLNKQRILHVKLGKNSEIGISRV